MAKDILIIDSLTYLSQNRSLFDHLDFIHSRDMIRPHVPLTN
ncbi:hypothetical protein PROVRETT_06329 [Providencia rettgeri DSM 1131]|nr:hypothetical protein PROVRETT_06329 [Providencia rettgeri DSM 1131]